jgi:deoxyhypusine synthase
MTDTEFTVEGFVDNYTRTSSFDAKTLSEAETVFNERVSRGDIEVEIWQVKPQIKFVKGVCNG